MMGTSTFSKHHQPWSIIFERIKPDVAGTHVDILPEIEGSAVRETMAGHLRSSRVQESDGERIHEDHTPALGQHPLKGVGDANLDYVEISS